MWIDGGGLAKGLAADRLAATLADHAAFAIDCAGDVRIGGRAGLARTLRIADPFGGPPVHALQLTAGAAATSGVGRRSWRTAGGAVAHHLIDPATGRPAWTGVVQATAFAPTALEAEILAKTALLRGPQGGRARSSTAAAACSCSPTGRSTCSRPRQAGGMTDAGSHVFWITSRAAGITALVLASVAVCAGLALGGRIGLLRGRSAS